MWCHWHNIAVQAHSAAMLPRSFACHGRQRQPINPPTLGHPPAAVAAVDGCIDLHTKQLRGTVRIGRHFDAAHHAAGHRDLQAGQPK